MAALLREISDTGVELEIAVVLEGLRQADELRAEPGVSALPPAQVTNPVPHVTWRGASAVPELPQPWHCTLSYLLLGDLFLQGLQLPVLFLVDEDPSVLNV